MLKNIYIYIYIYILEPVSLYIANHSRTPDFVQGLKHRKLDGPLVVLESLTTGLWGRSWKETRQRYVRASVMAFTLISCHNIGSQETGV